MARRKAQEKPVTDTVEVAETAETAVDPNIAALVAAGLSTEEVESMTAEERAELLAASEEGATIIGLDPAATGGDQTAVAEVTVEGGQVVAVRPLEGEEAAAVLAQLNEAQSEEAFADWPTTERVPAPVVAFADTMRGHESLVDHVIATPGHLEQLDVHTEEYVAQVRRLTGGDVKLMHYVVSTLAERLGV